MKRSHTRMLTCLQISRCIFPLVNLKTPDDFNNWQLHFFCNSFVSVLSDPFLLAEHYVFPDDKPTVDQNEVRTVEEESLVRVAYPELVESFMRDKAQAEEDKANSKNRFNSIMCSLKGTLRRAPSTSLPHRELILIKGVSSLTSVHRNNSGA